MNARNGFQYPSYFWMEIKMENIEMGMEIPKNIRNELGLMMLEMSKQSSLIEKEFQRMMKRGEFLNIPLRGWEYEHWEFKEEMKEKQDWILATLSFEEYMHKVILSWMMKKREWKQSIPARMKYFVVY